MTQTVKWILKNTKTEVKMTVSNEKYVNGCMHLEVCCSTKLCILAMGSSLFHICNFQPHDLVLSWSEYFFMSLCGPHLRNQQKSRIQQAKAEIFVSDNTLLCPPMFDARKCDPPNETITSDSDPVQVQWLWTCEKDHLCYDKPLNISIKLHDKVHPPRLSNP